METNTERRLRKLKELITLHGLANLATKAGLKPVYLEQIVKGVLLPKKADGSRSERALGDDAARAIEEAFALGRGWFDNNAEEDTMAPRELEMLGLFRQLDSELQSIVLGNIREVLEERARMKERMKLPSFSGHAESPAEDPKR